VENGSKNDKLNLTMIVQQKEEEIVRKLSYVEEDQEGDQ
jgi:hypothetical protein